MFLERRGTRLHLSLQPSPVMAVSRRSIIWTSGLRGPLSGLFLPSLQRFKVATPRAAVDIDLEVSSRHIYIASTTHSGTELWSAATPMPGDPRIY